MAKMKENMTSDKRNETIKALDELDKKYFTEINQHELESQIEEIERLKTLMTLSTVKDSKILPYRYER